MAAENGTTSTSVQDPAAQAQGAAIAESKGKGKAATAAEDVEDTSMALDDDDEDDEEEEADEVSFQISALRCPAPIPHWTSHRTPQLLCAWLLALCCAVVRQRTIQHTFADKLNYRRRLRLVRFPCAWTIRRDSPQPSISPPSSRAFGVANLV